MRLAEKFKRSSGKGRFSKLSLNKRGIEARSWQVINERDSQDFTGAEIVFVKRSYYYRRYQRQMMEISTRSFGAPASGTSFDATPAPLERFAVTVISPFSSLISHRDYNGTAIEAVGGSRSQNKLEMRQIVREKEETSPWKMRERRAEYRKCDAEEGNSARMAYEIEKRKNWRKIKRKMNRFRKKREKQGRHDYQDGSKLFTWL